MRSLRRVPLLIATTLLLTIIPRAASASAATSCSFDSSSATIAATVGSGASATLERNVDAIWFNGAPCGAADVFNTDTIDLTAPDDTSQESVVISIAGGLFEPGKTAEGDGHSEIEIPLDIADDDSLSVLGSAGPDNILVDTNGVDLDGANIGEREVMFGSLLAFIALDGGTRRDVLGMRAYTGTIVGGGGRDRLTGEVNQLATYDGGQGFDRLTVPDPNGIIAMSSGASSYDIQRTGGTDTATSMESLIGGDGKDTFLGSSASAIDDNFFGMGAADIFAPAGGNPSIDGGDGFDTVTFANAAPSVTIDMTGGRAQGTDGTVGFSKVEVLSGTSGDDLFVGDPVTGGIIEVDGGDGHDVLDMRSATHRQRVLLTSSFPLAVPSWVRFIADDVRIVRGGPLRDHIAVGEVSGVAPRARFLGGDGDDALVGGPHHDVIDGGSGDDHVDGRGGRDICTGGPGDDVVVHCEA